LFALFFNLCYYDKKTLIKETMMNKLATYVQKYAKDDNSVMPWMLALGAGGYALHTHKGLGELKALSMKHLADVEAAAKVKPTFTERLHDTVLDAASQATSKAINQGGSKVVSDMYEGGKVKLKDLWASRPAAKAAAAKAVAADKVKASANAAAQANAANVNKLRRMAQQQSAKWEPRVGSSQAE